MVTVQFTLFNYNTFKVQNLLECQNKLFINNFLQTLFISGSDLCT